jgi:DnaA family protein
VTEDSGIYKLPSQLPLGIRLNDEARFENYHISELNQPLLDELLEATRAPQFVYIRAQPGFGLSHLLQALCHQETRDGNPALYVPLSQRQQLDPAILQGAETLALICLDNLEAIAGDAAWERALFNTFNEVLAAGTRLVLGSREHPGALPIKLPDLQSRLQLAPLYQLRGLDDADKKQLLQLRARGRGMNLSPAVAEYVLNRTQRSLPALMEVLEELDRSSLAHQRPLTIPLVKQTMGW